MPTPKKAKILSSGAVQKIIDKEKPGYRVVELSPEDSELGIVRQKCSRTLPSLVKLRQVEVSPDAKAEPEEALWGNSSQFALVEPEGPALGSDLARRRRTVIVSHGKVITEQG